MKVLLCLTLMVAVAHAGFLDVLGQAVANVGQAVAQTAADVTGAALGGAFNVANSLKQSTTTVMSTFLQNAHLLQSLAGSTVQKRKFHEGHLSVDQVLREGSAAVEQVLFHYANELQNFVNDVQTAQFLQGNITQFLHDLQNTHDVHHEHLDAIMAQVNAALATALHQHHKRDLLSGLQGLFQTAVGQATSLLDNVHNALNSTSGGLLGAVTQHVQHLGDTLSGIKDTAAGLLASGQEGLATLTSTAHELVHQANVGVQGAAAQTLDTILNSQPTQ